MTPDAGGRNTAVSGIRSKRRRVQLRRWLIECVDPERSPQRWFVRPKRETEEVGSNWDVQNGSVQPTDRLPPDAQQVIAAGGEQRL